MNKKSILIIFLMMALSELGLCTTIYVDGRLPSNCTNGTYDLGTRSCGNGTNGKAFNSVVNAILQATAGDTIYIREGNYIENKITIGLNLKQ